MKSQRNIEKKLKELTQNRANLQGFIETYNPPVTISGWIGLVKQLLDEYKTSAQIDIVGWILKDHPF